MFELIEIAELKFPKEIKLDNNTIKPIKVSDEAKNIITKLLEKNPNTRLGKKGLKEIKVHPFFGNLSFDMIINKKLKSPFKPILDNDNLSNNFDEEYTSMDIKESPVGDWVSDYQEWFNDFDKDVDE